MKADDDNTDVEPNPPPTSLFVDTSIHRPSTSNLMVESDQEEKDEEDPYSNIGLPLQLWLLLFLLCINQ